MDITLIILCLLIVVLAVSNVLLVSMLKQLESITFSVGERTSRELDSIRERMKAIEIEKKEEDNGRENEKNC